MKIRTFSLLVATALYSTALSLPVHSTAQELQLGEYRLWGTDKERIPESITHDDHFTYIDYGEKFGDMDLMVSFDRVDGFDQPANSRIHDNTVIIEGVLDQITLKDIDSYLCIEKQKADADTSPDTAPIYKSRHVYPNPAKRRIVSQVNYLSGRLDTDYNTEGGPYSLTLTKDLYENFSQDILLPKGSRLFCDVQPSSSTAHEYSDCSLITLGDEQTTPYRLKRKKSNQYNHYSQGIQAGLRANSHASPCSPEQTDDLYKKIIPAGTGVFLFSYSDWFIPVSEELPDLSLLNVPVIYNAPKEDETE